MIITDEEIQQCVATAEKMALFFVAWPEEKMLLDLFDIRTAMRADLFSRIGDDDVAKLISEAFCATVIQRRREIESDGATARAMN
jgi:hypothetical protein